MSVTPARRAEIDQRRQEILAWVISGASTRQIARTLTSQGRKLSHAQVARDVKIVLAQMADANRPGADQLSELMNARYNRMLLAVWEKATAKPPDYDAMEKALRILEHLRKLNGLDIPVKGLGDEDNPLHVTILELARLYEQRTNGARVVEGEFKRLA